MPDQEIFSISEMTEDQAKRLIQSDEERCIVLYRNKDGTAVKAWSTCNGAPSATGIVPMWPCLK